MSRTRKNYTTAFKQKAVELSHARGNTEQVSRELGIYSYYCIVGEKNSILMVKIVFQVMVKLN